jgi:tryptophan-rich sensory protein
MERLPVKDAAALALFLLLCFGVAALGSMATVQGLREWYPSLEKPGFNPPNRVFGPVWTTLYTAMAVAAWLVWRRVGLDGGRWPLGWFALQLALNLAWSFLFFGMRLPGVAFAEVVMLWAAILGSILAFRPISLAATLLMVPYLAWVTFASVLNFEIWRLNR